MEEFNYNKDTDNTEQGYIEAVETTYRVITGRMDLSSLVYTKKGIYLMYDPHDVQEEELLEILQEMICHFEEYEEYEKCQEIKNIIDDNELRDLIPIITISKEELEKKKRADSMSNIVDIIKSFTKDTLNKKIDPGVWDSYMSNHWKPELPAAGSIPRDQAEKYKYAQNMFSRQTIFSNKEIWELLTKEDKELFKDKYKTFLKWVTKLDLKTKEYYINRLVHNKPLVPPYEEQGAWFESINKPVYNNSEKFNYEERYEGEENIDYNNVVVSFIGNLTCISNYSKSKINELKFQLLSFGILEVEMRTKDVDGKTLYTIIYNNNERLNKINW